jgi:hypothetical protein
MAHMAHIGAVIYRAGRTAGTHKEIPMASRYQPMPEIEFVPTPKPVPQLRMKTVLDRLNEELAAETAPAAPNEELDDLHPIVSRAVAELRDEIKELGVTVASLDSLEMAVKARFGRKLGD